jgi:site-specific recombinase XerC
VVLPEWFEGFTVFVSARYGVHQSIEMFREIVAVIDDGNSPLARAVLERSRHRTTKRSGSAVLEQFLVATGKLFVVDPQVERAPARRQARITATPLLWQPMMKDYLAAMLAHRERAAKRGTRQASNRCIEQRLTVLRNLALFCVERCGGWFSVSASDIDGFVSVVPQTRTSQIDDLRAFYRWARKQRRVLFDPTGHLVVQRRFKHQPVVLDNTAAKVLFQRWTADVNVHPHEAFIGLITMLHGASLSELQPLTIGSVDTIRMSVQLGRRPGPTILDPYTWAATERVIRLHEDEVGAVNPYLLATKLMRAKPKPPSKSILGNRITGAELGIDARTLRSMHLARFVEQFDPMLVSAAHAITPKGALYYQNDGINPVRFDQLDARTAQSIKRTQPSCPPSPGV